MSRKETSIFGLETITHYIGFCEKAVQQLENDQASLLFGFSAILALNHIPDWLQYKLTIEQRKVLGVSSVNEAKVKEHFENKNCDVKLVRSIANGFKHLRLSTDTQKIEGYGAGPYGVGPNGVPYLLIDRGDNFKGQDRWATGLTLCQHVLTFWTKELESIL
ncbi:MAG: hypothetical protein COC03_05455 [Robiginitomaculum sp.]|nr:MAG: hypothetical protein COC03_05455 [Robiginitomaculum sp.]PHQ66694.1 MAG: hypothetical protein COB92_07160 [Robiginitomaculum sp.]